MLAVIATGGKQYLVKPGQTVSIEKLPGDAGSVMAFDKVMLTASDDGSEVKIGAPYLTGVKVNAEILEQGRGKKIFVIKYKPKVRYRRKRGHRQWFTKVKVGEIVV